MPVIITPREEWGALPSRSWEPQVLPVNNVIFFPESRTKPCKTKKQCIRRMQKIQKHHMDYRNLPDIKFNFLVGLDGRIYEGTGWHMRAHDTHSSEYKELDDFISICYIGDYADWDPPDEAVEIGKRFIEWSIKQGYINLEYHQLFQPDASIIYEDPLPGTFKYKSIHHDI